MWRRRLVMRNLILVSTLVVSMAASAATPPEGVALEVRRGFFTETDIGAFFTLLGENRYSNAQTYVQLGVGYDIAQRVELSLSFGIGSSAQNCFATLNPAGDCALADNFTISFLNLT